MRWAPDSQNLQQDTKEYLHQMGYLNPREEKWWESEQGLKGKEGGNEGRVGGKGPESALEKL